MSHHLDWLLSASSALLAPKRMPPPPSLSRGVAEEIQNAVAAGKEVTVHEKAISAYGFNGFGYTVIDPETGVGGYLIEGKGSGGSLATKIGLGIAYILFTIGAAILIATILYVLSLYLAEFFAVFAVRQTQYSLYTSIIFLRMALGLLSASDYTFLKEHPCIQSIIGNLNAGLAGATRGLDLLTTKLAYLLSALGTSGTLGGLTYGIGLSSCF